MKKGIKYFLIVSIACIAVLVCRLFSADSKDEVDQTPPWHPFELNSELTLESIVDEGYRFAGSSCGQVQYTKQMGDTTIQYEVDVDCNSYEGRYQISMDPLLDDDSDSSNKTGSKSEKPSKTWEEELAENSYYPWKLEEIKECYQNISWRAFTISLGPTLDSSFIRDYVEQKGGYIIESTENWDTKIGGSFMVIHSESNLYFHCNVSNNNYSNPEEERWQFHFAGYIPPLNQKAIAKKKKWQEKKDKYYKW